MNGIDRKPRQTGRSEIHQRRRRLLLETLEQRTLLCANPVACENLLPGNPQSEWDIVGSGDDNIQGFATDISVDQGEAIQFKVATDATDYRLDIYRSGYYGDLGARKVATIQPSLVPFQQPTPDQDSETGLIDAGNWSVTASWNVPVDATSGVYFAKLVREDGIEGASHIVFIVRDDDGTSDLLFQTSDATWQAYNDWGGRSLYVGGPGVNPGRAYAVSYNRPFNTRGLTAKDWYFSAEYPMVRWLERNGYDVSYFTDVDSDRRGAELLEHNVFLSVGHDEYWSGAQRQNVEAARDAGVNLAFFSGNEIYWKTRWEPSIDGSATDYRTLVSYKETMNGAKIDPLPDVWTGTWRDPIFTPPADGGNPENALTGTIFTVNRGTGGDFGTSIQVPAEFASLRFWRNTSVADLQPGQTAVLSNGTLGYEWDEDLDNGFRPAGLIRMSSTTESVPQRLNSGFGALGDFGPGTATHSLTLYRAPSGALVFGAGTVQWAFGLDGNHDGVPTVEDPRMQQATVNLFADMGVQPTSLQTNLLSATASTDFTAPTSTINSPPNGFVVQSDTVQIAITGTSVDVGGGVVAGVEVSVDGGIRWHRATGRDDWSYTWSPSGASTATILVRAADDSGNLETPGPGVSVTILPDETTAPSITNVAPGIIDEQTVAIGWATDEAATSTVQYGTSPSLLDQSASSATLTKTHSLQLFGLTPNTTYYYRVSSTDEFGNSTTFPSATEPPLTFSTPAFFDTLPSDFAAGALAGLSPVLVGDGSLVLTPQHLADFEGSALPGDWQSTPWTTGGAATVSSGALHVDGALASTNQFFAGSRSLEFEASFSGEAFQHVGMADSLNAAPWAIFSSSDGSGLFARTNNGVQTQDTLIPGSWFGGDHTFRIDLGPSSVQYSIDGVQVAEHAFSVTTAVRPIASDSLTGGNLLNVNWLHLSPYATGGSIESRVFDAGTQVHWAAFQWTAETPATTSVQLSVRMGNTPQPDSTWTEFVPLQSSGVTVGGVSQYFQYRAVLTTSDNSISPRLSAVSVAHSPSSADITPPSVAVASPAAEETNVSPAAPVVVSFSEFVGAATVNSATFRLREAGSAVDLPAVIQLAGSTATLTPQTLLLPETVYEVTVSDQISDVAGNRQSQNTVWTFTTGWQEFVDETTSDFAAGTLTAGAEIAEIVDGEVTLAPVAGADFSGNSLPIDWNSVIWQTGGSTVVEAGQLSVDGALALHVPTFSPGHSVEFVATFTGEPFQHAGFANGLIETPWAIISTGSGGGLVARSSGTETALNSALLGSLHRFRIDWQPTQITYYVDGTVVATHNVNITQNMRLVASDLLAGGGALTVDWMRIGPYAVAGAFESRVFDAGQVVTWDAAFSSTVTPVGSEVILSYRLGNTPTPDSSWTAWVPLTSNGQVVGATARYAQYSATLGGLGGLTADESPQLNDIRFRYSPVTNDNSAPQFVSVSPPPNGTKIDAASIIQVVFNELIDPASLDANSVTLTNSATGALIPANISQSGSTFVLQPLDILAPNTTYEVAVSSQIADLSGNTLTAGSTWVFTTDFLRFTDSTTADFSAGTSDPGIAITGGAVSLEPAASGDFEGTELPNGWFSSPWESGGSAVANNGLSVDAARVGTDATFGPGRSLEFVATFDGSAGQHVGFGIDFNSSPWAIFSTREGGMLYARTSGFGDTPIGSQWLQSPHRFRIDWNAASMDYYIDEVLVASHNVSLTTAMRPLVSDATLDGQTLDVESMRLSPFASTGTFTSQVFGSNAVADWDTASWIQETPAGTSVSVAVRTGNTFTPDASWSAFSPLAASGQLVGVSSRYLQYQVALTTSDVNVTPSVDEFSIQYVTVPDTTPPTVISQSPAPGATNVDLLSPVTAMFSEMIDSATITSQSVRLRVVSAAGDVAASLSVFGNEVFIQPLALLQGTTEYEVIIDHTVADTAGNSLANSVLWQFTTAQGQFFDSTVDDFGNGTAANVVITADGDGALQLATVFSDDFAAATLEGHWTVTSWESSGGGPINVTTDGGVLNLAGAQLISDPATADAPLSGRVAFTAPFQHFGLATGFSAVAGNYWAIFSTGGTSDRLLARVNMSGATQDVDIGPLPAGFHDYRITPISGGFEFYVDGALRTTLSATLPAGVIMNAAMSAFLSAPMQIDQVAIESFVSAGTFSSRIFDATRSAVWDAAQWTADIPAGASITVETRSGDVASPDGTWSGWAPVQNGQTISSPAARYIQYRVTISLSDPNVSPTFFDMLIDWL